MNVAWSWSSCNDASISGPGGMCTTCKQVVPLDGTTLVQHALMGSGDMMTLCKGGGAVALDTIEHRGGKYILIAKSTGRVLGTHATKSEAEAQERAIQAAKHSDGATVRRFEHLDFSNALKSPEQTPEGFLRMEGLTARIGVQTYRQADGSEFRELRLPEEVFDDATMKSISLMPVCNTHPPKLLTPDDVKQYAVGSVGENVRRDGDWIAAPVMVWERSAIDAIRSGRKQLSWGYSCSLDEHQDPKLTEKYGKYDAIQRRIRGNHLATVDAARAGAGAALKMDAQDAVMIASNQEIKQMAQIKIDGFTFETPDPNAQAVVDRVIQKAAVDAERIVAESKAKVDALQAKADAAQAQLDAEKAKMIECEECEGAGKINGVKCENCGGTGKVPVLRDAKAKKDSIDRIVRCRVAARVPLVAEGRKHLGPDANLDALDDISLMRAIAAKLSPELKAKLDGESAAYVRAAYDCVTAIEGKKSAVDRARAAVRPTEPIKVDAAENTDALEDPDAARKAYQDRQSNAWKPAKA